MADRHEPASAVQELRFKDEALARLGLPDIGYPLSMDLLEQAVDFGGELPLASLLIGLQQRSSEKCANWQALEPALDELAELLTPADERTIVTAAGENWWVEIGAVDLNGPVVTIQPQDALIAALSPREDGRLRLASYRPLDAKSARHVIGVSLRPHPEHGVCMRENNWQYALDASAGMGQWYAAERGEAHLAGWPHGIGIMDDGTIDHRWRAMDSLPARRPAKVAIELVVAYGLGDHD